MTCSWSCAESWPQAPVLEGKSRLSEGILLSSLSFSSRPLMWPKARTQEQKWPWSEEAKSRIQNLQPDTGPTGQIWSQNSASHKDSQRATGIPILEPAVLPHVAWRGRGRDPMRVMAPALAKNATGASLQNTHYKTPSSSPASRLPLRRWDIPSSLPQWSRNKSRDHRSWSLRRKKGSDFQPALKTPG